MNKMILLVLLLLASVAVAQQVQDMATYDAGEWIYDLALEGQVLFVPEGDSEFGSPSIQIVDLSNPQNPDLLSAYQSPAHKVVVSGGRAYFASGGSLLFFDVSNPANPIYINSYDAGQIINDFAATPFYACLAVGDLEFGSPEFQIINIQDPSNPYMISSLPQRGSKIDVSGNRVFLADGGALSIIDISVPSTPVLYGSYSAGEGIRSFSWNGYYVYLTEGDPEFGSPSLQIVDISSAGNPQMVGSIDIYGGDLYATQDYLYMITGTTIRIYSLTTPESPQEIINYDPSFPGEDPFENPAYPAHLAVNPQQIICLAWGNYVKILEFQPPTGSISGTVTDSFSNAPIEGVVVQSTLVPAIDTTATDGHYDLLDLDAGSYVISFTHPSYYGFTSDTIAVEPGQEIVLNVLLQPSCQYVVGDANDNGAFNGIDVTYGVGYFKGGNVPPYSCNCNGSTWYVAGDVNGNCVFNGIDISYMVGYFKGGAVPMPCPDCPPARVLSQPERLHQTMEFSG